MPRILCGHITTISGQPRLGRCWGRWVALTWGQSFVPGALPGYTSWWISPVYVNDQTSIPELRGCQGGPVITVDVGDRLDLDMRLEGTTWNQTIIDKNSKKSKDFSIDLRG